MHLDSVTLRVFENDLDSHGPTKSNREKREPKVSFSRTKYFHPSTQDRWGRSSRFDRVNCVGLACVGWLPRFHFVYHWKHHAHSPHPLEINYVYFVLYLTTVDFCLCGLIALSNFTIIYRWKHHPHVKLTICVLFTIENITHPLKTNYMYFVLYLTTVDFCPI